MSSTLFIFFVYNVIIIVSDLEVTGGVPLLIIIIIVVLSIAPYLIDKGEHIVLYKINKNVYIKT